jgi:hypothetical protein
MQSICNQLLYEQAKGRRHLEDLKLIWVERDPHLMKNADVVRRSNTIRSRHFEQSESDIETVKLGNYSGHSVPLASTLLAFVPPSVTTDMELENMYESQMFEVTDDEEMQYAEQMMNSQGFDYWPSSLEESATKLQAWDPEEPPIQEAVTDNDATSVAGDNYPFESPAVTGSKALHEVLDMQLYLTGRNCSSTTEDMRFIKHGRPNIPELLAKARQQAEASGHKRIAVLLCAPPSIAKICRKACIKMSDSKIRFDYHEEGFG